MDKTNAGLWPVTLWFACLMQTKLDENTHKTGWDTCSQKWLLHRLEQEIGELRRAIEQGNTPLLIAREAADVANFAMMLADNATTEPEEA